MIYLDTSVLAKLVKREPESPALTEWLQARPDRWCTSQVAEVELPLALSRYGLGAGAAGPLLERVAVVALTAEVTRRAATYTELRTLDAIHVATAAFLADHLGAPVPVVTYDARMLRAADRLGLPTAAPGRTDTGAAGAP